MYRVRCRYVAGPGEPVVSDWVAFTLMKATQSPDAINSPSSSDGPR